jgi:hypothetical protein
VWILVAREVDGAVAIAALLDIADVVQDDGVICVERRQFMFKAQILFGSQQPLDKGEGRGKKDSISTMDKFISNGSDDVAFPSSW